jgi:hypothetical protein
VLLHLDADALRGFRLDVINEKTLDLEVKFYRRLLGL